MTAAYEKRPWPPPLSTTTEALEVAVEDAATRAKMSFNCAPERGPRGAESCVVPTSVEPS